MRNDYTYVYDDGQGAFAVLCLQRSNGWVIEIQQLDAHGASIGPSWKEGGHTYATFEDAKAEGVRIGKRMFIDLSS